MLVTGIHYRHPAVLANMAATLDIISGGRLELGIGAGWNEEESGAYGIELGTLTERFDRFDEACEVLTGLLRQVTNFDGRYFQLTDAYCEPKALQRPHPPICIGGSGEKRTLPRRAAGRSTGTTSAAARGFARKHDVLAGHCADIGRDPRRSRCRPTCGSAAERDSRQVIEEAAGWRPRTRPGIVYIAAPHDPAVLEPLAEAIRDSGLRARQN